MILLFTDFGLAGPYAGQMRAVLASAAPGIDTIDLMHDAPAHDPRRAAYLLAALADGFEPGNGLFELVRRRARRARHWRITWQPARLSATFHGRDLFAPVAAMIARGDPPPGDAIEMAAADLHHGAESPGAGWPDDLPEIVYIDGFGNLMTGLRAASVDPAAVLVAGAIGIRAARTFAESATGAPFWYGNSCGLVEIAVNQGSAAHRLGLATGDPVAVNPPGPR